jgi:hypothetical protein
MKQLPPLLFLLIAASLQAGHNDATGQTYREWPEKFRGGYVNAYLDGYMRGRSLAMTEASRLLDMNASEATRETIRAQLQSLKDKGVEEKYGALCFWAPRGQNPTLGQLTAILDKYIADHPETWDKQIGELAEEAFIDACEKRAKKP